MLRVLLFLLAGAGLLGCSEDGVFVDTSNLSDDAKACLRAANGMIGVARQAVNDPSSRPERRESRRVLMEDWIERLEAGEDPCSVYAAIGASSTTF